MAVTVTTTGSTFAPVIALVGGSGATVTWSCSGFSDQTGLTPSFSFGSAATRTVTMTVTGGGGDADVTLFNLGYDNTVDVGDFMPPSGFVKSAQAVSGLGNINSLTGLVYLLADRTALAGALDLSGMAALQFVQVYATNVTGVTLTGCTSLVRLQVEACNLTTLDLNPVAGNLKDLRAAAQQGGTLTFATLTSDMAVEYHYCVRDQTVVNPVPVSRLPVVRQYWPWHTGLSGELTLASSAIDNLQAYQNPFTTADLTDQFPAGRNGYLDLHACQLTAVTLAGCDGLTTILLNFNRLGQAAVDSILATVDSWGTSGGTLDLSTNTNPSSTAHVTALTGRGWTVTVDSAPSGAVTMTQTVTLSSNGNFTSAVALGHTVFLVACAYTLSAATVSSSNPLYNAVPYAGAELLQEIRSPFNGSFGVYHAVWMLPHCGDGFHPGIGITITNGTLVALYGYDVAGLGVAPVVDQSTSGTAATGSAVDSGTTAATLVDAEVIIGVAQIFAGASAGPGSPWTSGASPGGHNGWAGYQLASALGGTYRWTQTASGSDPWTAGVVTVAANGPVITAAASSASTATASVQGSTSVAAGIQSTPTIQGG